MPMTAKDKGKKAVAIIGYGSQGQAIALNLRDSGFDIVVGLRSRSGSIRQARRDGFRVESISPAIGEADVICMAFPDHLHGRVFTTVIEKNLRRNATLWFLHGMSIHFGFVKPPAGCDVILVAPHGPGEAVREKYLTDRSLSAFYAVAQNRSRKALATLVALANGIGLQRKRLVKTTFEAEAVGDMFGEQAVLCGGLAMLIKNGFEVLIENGLKPEHAYLEVAYQLDLIISLIKRFGIEGMLKRISVSARYGSVRGGPKVIDSSVKKRMEELFKEIRSGSFAEKLNALDRSDLTEIDKSLKKLSHPAFERAAKKFAG